MLTRGDNPIGRSSDLGCFISLKTNTFQENYKVTVSAYSRKRAYFLILNIIWIKNMSKHLLRNDKRINYIINGNTNI